MCLAAAAALEEAVLTDTVTGLRNRLAFSRNLESLIARGGTALSSSGA